jgi:hypothetical protein
LSSWVQASVVPPHVTELYYGRISELDSPTTSQ